MLDYHLHLWPHAQRDADTTLEQVAAYCEQAAAAGVAEVAVTEHLFRFTQARDRLDGFWDDLPGDDVLRSGMVAYWDHHARVDLDTYVEVVEAAKAEGLPVVLGLEVDYYQDRMDDVADLLEGYPFDVLLGSVHWLGAWRFDDLDDPPSMGQWSARRVDDCWTAYTDAMEELAASGSCDVLAHPDLVKAAGHVPASPTEWWDRLAEATATHHLAAEVSSAGWRKPVREQYPAHPLLVRLAARGVPFTTASDAHRLEQVADRSHELRAMLASVGVERLQAYRGRRPHTVPLASPSETASRAAPHDGVSPARPGEAARES